jgi:hypothetical protein
MCAIRWIWALLGKVGFILLGALCVLFRTYSFKEVWCGCFHENRWEFSASEGWCSCAATPFVRVHGKWLPDEAEALFKRRIDELARAHGLLDRGEDHYGLVATGEFVVTSAAIERT